MTSFSATTSNTEVVEKSSISLAESCVCVNAYIIYCESRPRNKLIHELFLVEVAKGLLIQSGHSSDDLENSDGHSFSDPAEVPPSFRLTGKHFLEELPPCDSGRLRQCVCAVYAAKKRKKESYIMISLQIMQGGIVPNHLF